MASLPSNTFMFNYNAKQYNPTTYTFPKTQGQLFDNDLVLNGAPNSYTEDSVYFGNTNRYMGYTYANNASNPFNISTSNPNFTFIYKTSGWNTADDRNIFVNRNSDYNLMIRSNRVIFRSGEQLKYLPSNNPQYIVIRIDSNRLVTREEWTADGTKVNTGSTTPSAFGGDTNGIGFFTGFATGGEYFQQTFYWMYCSRETLTDAQVLQVIKYNEGSSFGIEPDTINFPSTASSTTVDVTSDNPWTASTQDSWITVSPSTGSSDATVTISVASNTLGGQRTGTVTFTDGEDEVELSVSQDRLYSVIVKNLYRNGTSIKQMYRNGECIYKQFNRFYFSVDVDSLTFDYTGGSQTINITASDEWSMTLPNWLTASSTTGTGNATVTITAGNYTGDTAQVGNIVITCNGKTHTVAVTQNPVFVPYENRYLTIRITGTGNLVWYTTDANYAKTISYSKDDGATWTDVTSTTAGTSIPTSIGDVILFKGTNSSYSNNNTTTNSRFQNSSVEFIVEGNIMSMIYGDNFIGKNSFPANTAANVARFFQYCSGLTDASNLILPATAVTNYCYQGIFDGCSKMTVAPALPATTLGTDCYKNLFLRCTSMTAAPELPAPTLVSGCYGATFYGCTSLRYIKCLATSGINTTNCSSWCTSVPTGSSGTFVKASGASWGSGVNGIPTGWTIVDAT